jgi:hypothetical protein
MENQTKKSHLTLIQGGGGVADPMDDFEVPRLKGTISRSKLSWLILTKVILLASVLYVAYGR